MKLLLAFSLFEVGTVPWSAPSIFARGQKKSPKLERWQRIVHDACLMVMDQKGVDTYFGPVALHTRFIRKTEPGYKDGDPAWVAVGESESKRPNLTNLMKSLEDALNGTIYADDRQVCQQHQSLRFGPKEGFMIAVYEVDPDQGLDTDVFDGRHEE